MYATKTRRLFLMANFGIYCFIYPSSLFLLMTDGVPAGTEWMASLMLGLEGLAATGWVVINYGLRRGCLAAGIMLVGAFAVEAIGVKTGFPFGQYYYTDALSPQLLAVPLGITFAWLMMILSSFFMARFLVERLWPRQRLATVAMLSATLAVLSDLVMEPVAVHVQGYWVWLDRSSYYGVPWTNFAAWAVVGVGLALVLGYLLKLQFGTPLASRHTYAFMPFALYYMNLVLFTAINLTHHNYLAGAIGIGLLGAGVLVGWRAYTRGRPGLAFLSTFGNPTSQPVED